MRIQIYHIPDVKEASKYPLSNNNNAHSMYDKVWGSRTARRPNSCTARALRFVHPLKGHRWGMGQKRCPARAQRANAPPPAITSAESHTKQSENLTGTVRLTVPKMTLSLASGGCARLVLAQGGCKTVINNTFGEVELPLKYRASCGPYSHASNSNISHGVKSLKKKSIGLQCQAEYCHDQEELPQA